MAILKGYGSKLQGSAGDLTFRRRKGSTVVSEKTTSVTNVRSSAQQKHRMKWGNVIQMYKGVNPLLKNAFENKAQGVTDYNMFVKINMQGVPVFLTKSEVAGGACVVAPYQISQGSLPAIVVTGEDSDRTTDIALGTLTISESTTVADFSNAVVQNNTNFSYGEQISFFDIRQRVNAATAIPYGYFTATGVVLDKENNALLWSVVSKLGFQSKTGYLGSGSITEDGAFCWVHSRKKSGSTLVSSQLLLDNNSLLDSYTSQDAYDNAVATYGGESDVFLSPEVNSSASKTTVVDNTPSGDASSLQKTLTLVANPPAGGTVSGGGQFSVGSTPQISAVANAGYTFTGWNDGVASATRTVTLNADLTLTATFTANSGGEGNEGGL